MTRARVLRSGFIAIIAAGLLIANMVSTLWAETQAAETKPTAAQQAKPTPEPQKPADPKAAASAKPAAEGQKPADPKAAAAPAPAREQTPDAKALADARKETDVDKRIEALKKVIADFPKTPSAATAESTIFSSLVSKSTADIKSLQEQAKKWTDGAATPNEQARRLGQVATSFATNGVLLEEAEQYAKKSLDLIANEKPWIDAEKKAAADTAADGGRGGRGGQGGPTRTPPTDAEYSSRWQSMRQTGLMTLAQAYEKRGKAADAEKTYREAYSLAPKTGTAAALKLAEFAKAAGHPYEQLEYLTIATVAGKVTAASRAELEALYKQTHGGTVADLDAMLDERYEKDATKVDAKPYKATPKRTDRMVVAELFTGSGCPPCVAADLAFEAAIERYNPKDVAVLVYHLHIPRPDPMTNPSTVTRKEFYDVPGTPTYFIDGGNQKVGGGAASGAEKLFTDNVQAVVDKRLEVKSGAVLKLQAAMKNGKVDVAVDVTKLPATGKADQKARLQVVLVEELVHYTGENGVRFHPMAVRSLASVEKGKLGFELKPGQSAKRTYSFDVAKIVEDAKAHLDEMEGGANQRFGKFQFIERKNGINADNLRVVAFIQDEGSKEILQAAVVDLGKAAK